MISLSFDPENDSPDVMKLYGDGTDSGIVDWKFLTTNSLNDLDPILDNYSQRIIKDYDEDGKHIELGNENPDYRLSFRNSMRFGPLSLSFLI